jgi:DUF1365 family protein
MSGPGRRPGPIAQPAGRAAGAPAQPLLGVGTVRHERLRPHRHAFAYATYFVLLPLRALRDGTPCALPRNRAGLLSFHDADHGEGGPDALAWFEDVLAREGIEADGEVWLHTFPRVLGYAFKPVSFWYAHRRDGSLAAVLAEVNNTFGERHAYLLAGPELGWGRELRARKVFHVSPFCRVEGEYRFRFLRTGAHVGPVAAATTLEEPVADAAPAPGTAAQLAPLHAAGRRAPAPTPAIAPQGPAGRTLVRIDHHDGDGALLLTSVSGTLEACTAAALRRVFFAMPLMTFGVIVRIHLHALRLWRKRVPFFSKPAAPARFVTR